MRLALRLYLVLVPVCRRDPCDNVTIDYQQAAFAPSAAHPSADGTRSPLSATVYYLLTVLGSSPSIYKFPARDGRQRLGGSR